MTTQPATSPGHTGAPRAAEKCSACGTTSPLLFVARDVNREVTRTPFPYYKCPACELVFLSPIPPDLSRYYPADYHGFPADLAEATRLAESDRYKLEIVERFKSGGRLLEIGPSWGSFLLLAKLAGFEAEAVEMDSHCCRFLREQIGVNVIATADPAPALGPLPPYDVIALWHVLEHVPQPWVLLRAAIARLKPDGILVVATPNPAALQFRITGRRWPHVDAPRHVTLIPLALLAKNAKASGATLAWNTTRDRGSLGWDVFGWEFFFGNLSSSARTRGRLRMLGRGIAKLMSPLERREGTGSAFTAVFRKDGAR